MNREIKFRIWNGRKMIFGPTDDNPNSSWILAFSNTVNYPLQQYTGLKDKNSKDIYEGDFVRIFYHDKVDSNGDTVKCEWSKIEIVSWYSNWTKFAIGLCGLSLPTNPNDIEIVGNIFENKK